jgi:hypothetical protein
MIVFVLKQSSRCFLLVLSNLSQYLLPLSLPPIPCSYFYPSILLSLSFYPYPSIPIPIPSPTPTPKLKSIVQYRSAVLNVLVAGSIINILMSLFSLFSLSSSFCLSVCFSFSVPSLSLSLALSLSLSLSLSVSLSIFLLFLSLSLSRDPYP